MSPRTPQGSHQAPPDAPTPARGRGRPRDEQAEQSIIDSTIAILDESGFAGLSIEAVAARAGVDAQPGEARLVQDRDGGVDD